MRLSCRRWASRGSLWAETGFLWLGQINQPILQSCFSQPGDSESKEAAKQRSGRAAAPAWCSGSCGDCLWLSCLLSSGPLSLLFLSSPSGLRSRRPAEPFPTLEDPCGSPHSYSPVVARRTWSSADGAAAPRQTCTPGVWGFKSRGSDTQMYPTPRPPPPGAQV